MDAAASLYHKLSPLMKHECFRVYGVLRGGTTAAVAFYAACSHVSHSCVLVNSPEEANLIIDDIYDSGATAKRFEHYGKPFAVLFDKRDLPWKGKWLVMPYEVERGEDRSAEDIVTRLLQYIGEDPNREGLRETPKRVLKAWKERTSGIHVDPSSFIKTFEDGAEGSSNAWVIVTGIPVVSLCEHHLADIRGTASVGYIPDGRIIGLSKLARIVDCYSRRLQVQERITNSVADLLDTKLKPVAVGVLIKASHACLSTRGTRIHGALTVTSALRGAALTEPDCRAEFLKLCEMGSSQENTF